jgi:membrane-associated phospholipid phosphatase
MRVPLIRRSEWVLIAYFIYAAVLAFYRVGTFPNRAAIALIVPVALVVLAYADTRSRSNVWSIVRDWLPAALVLTAYWTIDWVTRPPGDRELEHALIGWDRWLLNDWGLREAIERSGPVVPHVLECAYLLLYAVLPVSIAGFYLCHRRRSLDDFLFPFLLGTLTTYALLPHFPTEGPRFAFPGDDLPLEISIVRRFNMWILKHGDIHSSVFPSGHVAVGFSAAFAMRLALPQRPALASTLFTIAVLVWVGTIYGRYHYAADGLAGLIVSAAAIAASRAMRSRE